MDDDLRRAIARIPQFSGKTEAQLRPKRLGGQTNIVYHIVDGGEDLILRMPGKGTEEYIDRRVEAHNTRAAAAAGVGAEALFIDESDGLMVIRHLQGRTMSPEAFQRDDAAVERAGIAMGRMHRSGQEFQFRFELFSMIDDYLRVLSGTSIDMPEGYDDAVAEARAIREAIEADPVPLAPCHNDPLCENFIDDGKRMWIVDWEYSGMNDPFWDVGDVSVEAGLTPEQDQKLLQAYLGREPTESEVGRTILYKAACDLLWTLWGLIQYSNDNPAEDFWAYSVERFERSQMLMASPIFAESLKSVRKSA